MITEKCFSYKLTAVRTESKMIRQRIDVIGKDYPAPGASVPFFLTNKMVAICSRSLPFVTDFQRVHWPWNGTRTSFPGAPRNHANGGHPQSGLTKKAGSS
jgi:hypothetical protein